MPNSLAVDTSYDNVSSNSAKLLFISVIKDCFNYQIFTLSLVIFSVVLINSMHFSHCHGQTLHFDIIKSFIMSLAAI